VIGSALEWYDFSLYGVTAALVLAPLFFPTFSPAAGSLAAFGTFAVGFFSRRVRYTGLVVAREVSGAVVGGFTPLVATSLVLWSEGRS